jgi:NADH-quinone oxidoreductase subunit N
LPVKIGVFTIFVRTLMTTFEIFHTFWGPMLLFYGLGSLLVGAFGALTERAFKKFIAYSSINQIGFLLLGLSTGQLVGLQSVILFFLIYILTTVLLFAVFLNLENSLTGEHFRYVSELGFLSPHEWLSRIALSFVFFSFAGLPPFAGFFSKFYLLLHLFEEGFLVAVLVGIVTSLISSYYYLTLVTYIWFGSNLLGSTKWTSTPWTSNLMNKQKTLVGFPVFTAKWDQVNQILVLFLIAFLLFFVFGNEFFLNATYSLAQACVYYPNGFSV